MLIYSISGFLLALGVVVFRIFAFLGVGRMGGVVGLCFMLMGSAGVWMLVWRWVGRLVFGVLVLGGLGAGCRTVTIGFSHRMSEWW